jgi:hypothetical protein
MGGGDQRLAHSAIVTEKQRRSNGDIGCFNGLETIMARDHKTRTIEEEVGYCFRCGWTDRTRRGVGQVPFELLGLKTCTIETKSREFGA